jgi:hypothetical protein
MAKTKKVLSLFLVALMTVFTVLSYVPAKAATTPKLAFVSKTAATYTQDQMISFSVKAANYTGKVMYRVMLSSGKNYINIWNTPKTGYYYTKWTPSGTTTFPIHWLASQLKPGFYSMTVLVKRVGSKLPYDSYVNTASFEVKSSEATISSIDDVKATVAVGTAYTLPATVKATMSDGTSKDVAVVWAPATVDTTKAGDYKFVGKVDGYDKDVNLVLTVAEPKVTVTAVAANQIKVAFDQAVDTTKATFAVKMGYVPVDVTAKFADDAKSAVLTSDSNLLAGDYTVSVKGIGLTTEDYALKVEAQKMVSFTIKTTQLLAKTADQDLIYEAKDQYGNAFDYASTNFTTYAYNVTTSSNTATIKVGINKFAVALTNPTAKDNIIVTLVDNASGLSQTVTIPVVDNSLANTIAFGTPVPKKDNTRIYVSEDNKDNLYIPFTAKDQYGNAMTLDLGDYTFISSNTSIVDPKNFALYDANDDGINESINFATGATSGTVTITAVALKTGKTATVSFTTYDPAALKAISLVQPAGLIVAKESVTVNYTAVDTFGSTAKLSNVNDLVWFSTKPTVVDVTKDIAVDAKGVLTITPEADGTTTVSAFLNGVKQGDITLTVNKAAVETKITKVLPTALTYFAANAGTYTYKVADFEIIDQYNRVVKTPTGTVTVAVKDGTSDVVSATSNSAIVTAAAVGTKTLTVTYTIGTVVLTKDFTVNVIDDAAVVGYTVTPITNTVLYAKSFAGLRAAGKYARTFTIANGLDANNNKVALSNAVANDMTLTNSDPTAVTVSGTSVYAVRTVDKGASTVAAWKDGKKIAEVNFTTSTVAPVLSTLTYADASYTVDVAKTLDLTTKLTGNDQYGVAYIVPSGAWFSLDKSIATVTNGVVTGVKAGTTTIIYVAPNGANININVTVD